jgi:DNA mismatch repair ATPase MutL
MLENVIGDLFGAELLRSSLQTIQLDVDLNSGFEIARAPSSAAVRLIVPQYTLHEQQQQQQIMRKTNDRMWFFVNDEYVAQWPELAALLQARFSSNNTNLYPFAIVSITVTPTSLSSHNVVGVRERIVNQIRNQLSTLTRLSKGK